MPSYNETPADLEKKLVGTYILYDGKLCHVRTCGATTDVEGNQLTTINLRWDDAQGKQEWVLYDPDKVKIPTFDAHYFNLDNDTQGEWSTNVMAWQVSRKSQRQWKVGISSNTYKITNPIDNIYPTLTWVSKGYHRIDFSFKVLSCLLRPYYPSWLEVFHLVKKCEAVAISPDFAVCLSNISNTKYLLRSKYGFIGEVTESTIEVHHQPSTQEVSDLIKRKHLPVRLHTCH